MTIGNRPQSTVRREPPDPETGDANHIRVELYIRAPTIETGNRQQDVYDRLRSLNEAGDIAELSVEVWGMQVRIEDDANPAMDDTHTRRVRDQYETFREWARGHGCELEPAFSICTTGSLITDHREQVVRLPMICLAVYDDTELIAVAPCSTDDGSYTVEDCLTRLEAADGVPRLSPAAI